MPPLNSADEIKRITALSDNAHFTSVFNMAQTSSPEEVAKSYKKLSLLTHPDKNSNSPEATIAFQKLQNAYQEWTEHFELMQKTRPVPRTAQQNQSSEGTPKPAQRAAPTPSQTSETRSTHTQPPPPPMPPQGSKHQNQTSETRSAHTQPPPPPMPPQGSKHQNQTSETRSAHTQPPPPPMPPQGSKHQNQTSETRSAHTKRPPPPPPPPPKPTQNARSSNTEPLPNPNTFGGPYVPPMPKRQDEFDFFNNIPDSEFEGFPTPNNSPSPNQGDFEFFNNLPDSSFEGFPTPNDSPPTTPLKRANPLPKQSSEEGLDKIVRESRKQRSPHTSPPVTPNTEKLTEQEFAARMREMLAKGDAPSPSTTEKESSPSKTEKEQPFNKTQDKNGHYSIKTSAEILAAMDKVITQYNQNNREISKDFGFKKFEQLKELRDTFRMNANPDTLKQFIKTAGIAREGFGKAQHGSTTSVKTFYANLKSDGAKAAVHKAVGLEQSQSHFSSLKTQLKGLIEREKKSDAPKEAENTSDRKDDHYHP